MEVRVLPSCCMCCSNTCLLTRLYGSLERCVDWIVLLFCEFNPYRDTGLHTQLTHKTTMQPPGAASKHVYCCYRVFVLCWQQGQMGLSTACFVQAADGSVAATYSGPAMLPPQPRPRPPPHSSPARVRRTLPIHERRRNRQCSTAGIPLPYRSRSGQRVRLRKLHPCSRQPGAVGLPRPRGPTAARSTDLPCPEVAPDDRGSVEDECHTHAGGGGLRRRSLHAGACPGRLAHPCDQSLPGQCAPQRGTQYMISAWVGCMLALIVRMC